MKTCIRFCVHAVLYVCRSGKSFEQIWRSKSKYNISLIECRASVRPSDLRYALKRSCPLCQDTDTVNIFCSTSFNRLKYSDLCKGFSYNPGVTVYNCHQYFIGRVPVNLHSDVPQRYWNPLVLYLHRCVNILVLWDMTVQIAI
jgi:hypothetical protein